MGGGGKPAIARNLDEDYPIKGPMEEVVTVEVFGKMEEVEVHKVKGPKVLQMDGTTSYLLWMNNNIPNSGARNPTFSSIDDSGKKIFRYRGKMDQHILITIAAKKNAKLREWLEAEAEKKRLRGEQSGPASADQALEAELESKRKQDDLKMKGINLEVPDFMRSVYKDRPFLT
mmetsp:Transcript_64154/g.141387  ORF Transcript_64154/g.141387 Transcript_64154/m.141387 type:complete len:173 (+) Transcript_64154:89-607(+)